jgi:hypothetical protein
MLRTHIHTLSINAGGESRQGQRRTQQPPLHQSGDHTALVDPFSPLPLPKFYSNSSSSSPQKVPKGGSSAPGYLPRPLTAVGWQGWDSHNSGGYNYGGYNVPGGVVPRQRQGHGE